MRLIGHIPDEALARRFGDFLLTQSMDNDVEPASQGWAIWVHHDDHLPTATEHLKAFLAAPDDPRFAGVSGAANTIRKETEKAEARRAQLHINVRTNWHSRMHGVRPLTAALMIACVLVAGASKLGKMYEGAMDALLFNGAPSFDEWSNPELYDPDGELMQDLLKNPPPPPDPRTIPELDDPDGDFVRVWKALHVGAMGAAFKRITQGEIWRLVTPIFIHFGWLHLVFNMFWLYDLGGLVEIRKSTWFLALIVLIIAIISNVAQAWMDGPLFGGMSGVLYGLFGYIWMKQRYEPHLHIALAPNTVPMMLGWLVFCMTGAVGPVGNTAHVIGMVTGIAIGVARPMFRQWRKGAA